MPLINWMRNNSRLRTATVFFYDLIAVGVALALSFQIRFDFNIPHEYQELLWSSLPLIYVVQSPLFVFQGLYRGVWAFASTPDLFLIIRTSFLSVLSLAAVLFIVKDRLIGWPRSIFILDFVFLTMILGGGRFSYRTGRELYRSLKNKQKRILVIGAGESGSFITRQFKARPELAAKVIGFLDDKQSLKGSVIQGARVFGPLSVLDEILVKHRPHEVIIAIPTLSGVKVKKILEASRSFGIPCRICPPIKDILMGTVELTQMRDVRVEDLLRRDQVQIDTEGLTNLIAGQVVLVTGAAGSIGSELCRQLLKFNPKRLVVFDRSEYNLYVLDQEFRTKGLVGGTNDVVTVVIGDVLDKHRLNQVFEHYKPSMVFHAAAYKHVPLMEENVYEAVKNNVQGAFNLANIALAHAVSTFVLVSTDKAVRPTNIMGATKRMAEQVIHALAANTPMKSIAVRFGNVLDSQGSVLPRFREQIAAGGPVTVTHRDVTRYFMTIPEASQLVIQAALLGRGGEVFLLDMGDPVLIRELAEDLIRLSGLKPYEDIEIVFTGLRRGEKLFEELLFDINHAQKTSHPKILVSRNEHDEVLPVDWKAALTQLDLIDAFNDQSQLLSWIKEWVPDYSGQGQNGLVVSAGEDDQEDSDKRPSKATTQTRGFLH